MTLLEAPTGTSLFNYKEIQQEIVHTLLLEEYGVSKKWVIIMDKRQDEMRLRLNNWWIEILIPIQNVFGRKIRRKSALHSRNLFASTQVINRPRSDSPLHIDSETYQIRTGK